MTMSAEYKSNFAVLRLKCRRLHMSEKNLKKISSATKNPKQTNKQKNNVKHTVLFRKLSKLNYSGTCSSDQRIYIYIYNVSDVGDFLHEKLVLFDTIKQSIFHHRKVCFWIYKIHKTVGISMFALLVYSNYFSWRNITNICITWWSIDKGIKVMNKGLFTTCIYNYL